MTTEKQINHSEIDMSYIGSMMNIKFSKMQDKYYINMPINVGNCVAQQVNKKEDCIKTGYNYFKEGLRCLFNSFRFYFQFKKLEQEQTKMEIVRNLETK